MKRAADDVPEKKNDVKRAAGKEELVAQSPWPTRDLGMSSHARAQLEHSPPNCAPYYARWNKIALPGTKVATAIGTKTYDNENAILLWRTLLGYAEAPPFDAEQQARFAHGIANEGFARRLYEHFMDVEVTLHDRTVDPLHPWLMDGCDGHARGKENPLGTGTAAGAEREYGIEIKCPATKMMTEIYVHYMIQVQTEMAEHDFPWWDFIVYSGPGEYADEPGAVHMPHRLLVTRVWRSPTAWMLVLEKSTYFMDCIRYGVQPETAFLLDTPEKQAPLRAPSVRTLVLLDKTFKESPLPRPADAPAPEPAAAPAGDAMDLQ
jgi:hypothetical protein